MKRILSLTLLIYISFYSYAQDYTYAWLTDLHIGAPGADNDLNLVISDINNRKDISFVVVTGDITEKGRNDELEKSKQILDQLKKPYYIIPGNHDTKWSESGGVKFKELWGDDKFSFDLNNSWHIGLNSGIIFRGGGGHIAPEDLIWLKDTLYNLKPERLFLYVHHPLDGEVDNWFKVINAVTEFNPAIIFSGHGHQIKVFDAAGVHSVMGRSTLTAKSSPGYNLISISKDSLNLTEVLPGVKSEIVVRLPLTIASINSIDSTQFINYGSSDVSIINFNTSVSAPLYYADGRIFISTYNEGIICTDLNGKRLWSYDPNGTIISKPVFNDGLLVSATAEGDLFALEAHTGKVVQIIGLGESITSQLEVIDVKYENEQTKGVIVGTGNGNLYCYDLYTFELIWENNSAEGMIETKPLFINGALVYGSWDGYLYCINSSSGVLNWKWTENKNFYYSPAAVIPVTDGKNIYLSTPDKFVSAVDLLLGKTVWRKNFEAWETIQISRDKELLYVKSVENIFHIIKAKDGTTVKKIDIQFGLDTTPSPPVETESFILFGSKNGNIYSINKKDYTWQQELFLGTSRIHSVIRAGNIIAAINMDGTLALIKL